MAYKILAVLALAAVASALELHHAAPSSYVEDHAAPVYHKAAPVYSSHHGNHGDHHEPEHYHDSPPHYEFAYSVHDQHSGDVKTQQESRKDDVVHGSYSLIDADGYKRTVEYTADDVHGFQATVHREPLHHHAGPAEHEYHY